MESTVHRLPNSICFQVDALIASLSELYCCSTQVAIGHAISLFADRLVGRQSSGFRPATNLPLDVTGLPLSPASPNSPRQRLWADTTSPLKTNKLFKYYKLQECYDGYKFLPFDVERQSCTEDPADIVALKLFAFDAGLHDRYMSVKKYDFSKVLKRILDSVKYQGNRGPQEEICLAALNKKLGSSLQPNSKLYYSAGYCGTPDAVEIQNGQVVSVAEFKSTRLNEALLESKVFNPAKVQLEFCMRAARVNKGYIVVHLSTVGDQQPFEEQTRIIEVTGGAEESKKMREKEEMQQRFLRDLMNKTEKQLPEELISLLNQISGGCLEKRGEASEGIITYSEDDEDWPNAINLNKRKATKL